MSTQMALVGAKLEMGELTARPDQRLKRGARRTVSSTTPQVQVQYGAALAPGKQKP